MRQAGIVVPVAPIKRIGVLEAIVGCVECGCEDVEVEAVVVVLRDLGIANFALHIRSTLEAIITNGAITREAGEQWWEAVQELDARGQFFASVNNVICVATVR